MGARRGDRLSEEQIQRLLEQMEEVAGSDQREGIPALADELWASRRSVVPIMVERLASGRSMAPLLLLELLPTFSASGARQQLSRVARDTRAPDLVRFSARRRMGWAERGEGRARVAFLGSLQDGVATLAEALDTLREVPYPLSGETMEEVLKYLLVMPPAQAREVVTLGFRTVGRRIAPLLRALLHAPEPSLRGIALDGTLEVEDPGAIAAIERAANLSGNSDFASRARDAVQRLASAPHGGEGGAGSAPRSLPRLHSAYLSAIDGSGGQMAVVVRQLDEAVVAVSQFFFLDRWGVKDTIGLGAMAWEDAGELYGTRGDRLDALRGEREGEEIPLVEVNGAVLRGALVEAVRINRETNHRLPSEYEIWEPFLHEEDPPASDEPVAAAELDDVGYLDRYDLYQRSAELLDHRFFRSWLFEPGEVARALDRLLPHSPRELTGHHFRPIIDALLKGAARDELRGRLRRQAWLLRAAGEGAESELALAAAAGLSERHSSDPARHPLLQRMVLFGLTPFLEFRAQLQ
jgi:hypothetical protein